MSAQHQVAKIVSGGQTGADRGGLNAAIDAGVPHGGWCPMGRKAEDGAIPGQYRLVEMETDDYLARTEANVVDSDCSIVFTFGKPTGGSKKTVAFAAKHRRPCLCVNLDKVSDQWAAEAILQWLVPTAEVLLDAMTPPPNPVVNIAGSRESKAPGIQQRVRDVMLAVLRPTTRAPESI